MWRREIVVAGYEEDIASAALNHLRVIVDAAFVFESF